MTETRHAGWTKSAAWLGKAALSAAIAGLLAMGALSSACKAAPDTARRLQYRVLHPVFGDIGTYTNTIEPNGDTTMVRTSVHLMVSALGVVLHREDAERTERWKDGRIREFHGITTINGKKISVNGKVDGLRFIITSPLGTVIVPDTIGLSNPWSAAFLNSTTMMRTDTGQVEQVHISGGEADLVKINGKNIKAREYQVDGTLRYKIWLDQQNVPVEFTVDDDSGQINFSLIH